MVRYLASVVTVFFSLSTNHADDDDADVDTTQSYAKKNQTLSMLKILHVQNHLVYPFSHEFHYIQSHIHTCSEYVPNTCVPLIVH